MMVVCGELHEAGSYLLPTVQAKYDRLSDDS